MSKLNNTEITIPIIKEAIDALKRHQLRSGLLPTRLLGGVNDVPEGVTASAVISWINGTVKTVNKEHLDFVLDLWAGQPDLETYKVKKKKRRRVKRPSPVPSNRIPISDDYTRLFGRYKDKGILPGQIFEDATDVPEGLSASMVSSWLFGGIKTAEKEYLDYVLCRCKALEQLPRRRINITEKMRQDLKDQSERTGIGPSILLDQASECPEGLSATMISGWVHSYTQTVNKEHFDFVLDLWAGQPDLKVCKVKNKRRSIKNRSHLIPINRMPLSEELILVLEPYRDAGLLPSQIFENAKKVPEGLSTILVSKWLSRGAKTIEKKQFDYVLRRCKALEKAPYRRINITEKMRQDLKDQSERTGIGATALLGQIKGCPEEVSANMISAWAHGHTKTARKDHYEYVLREWKRL